MLHNWRWALVHDRDLVRLQPGASHVDSHAIDVRRSHRRQIRLEDAGAGFDRQRAVDRRDPDTLDQVLGEAAEAVAAHLAVGAVGVDNHHPRRRGVRVLGDQDAVGADAEMPIADARRERRPIDIVQVRVLTQRVDQQEVVARALHFEEWD